MVTCNDESLWRKMWAYKDHGKSYNAVYEIDHPPGFKWLHESFGTNLRMTEMQAAIGRIQLKRMPKWHRIRLQYANKIWNMASNIQALRAPSLSCSSCDNNCDFSDGCEHAAYKCYIFVKQDQLKEYWNRDRISKEINALGVPCFSGSCSEVYLEKAFDKTVFKPTERLSIAKELGEASLMFLVHPTLKKSEIQLTCEAISTVMKLASK